MLQTTTSYSRAGIDDIFVTCDDCLIYSGPCACTCQVRVYQWLDGPPRLVLLFLDVITVPTAVTICNARTYPVYIVLQPLVQLDDFDREQQLVVELGRGNIYVQVRHILC